MNVFYLCADRGVPPDGTKGASIHFRSLAKALGDTGHEVTAFMAAEPQGSAEFPCRLRRFRSTGSVLAAAAAAGRPDFVCERYSLGGTRGLAASRRLDVPFALEVNAPLVREAELHRPATVRPGDAETERRLFSEADLVVAVSEPLRRHVAQIRGTDAGTAVLRNGCDPERIPPRPGPPAPDTHVLAFLGHPKPWHGAARLPRLLAELVAVGYDARLLLVGGGDGTAPVLAEAERHGVTGRVEVTGPVDPGQVGAHLARASVAVAPYLANPFFYFCPLKVIECMAAGLPVVTTRQGDLPEIVGNAGVLVEPGDPQALAVAVRTLLQSPRRRRRLGARARRRAGRHFTWSRTARRLLELAAPLVGARERTA